MRPGKEPFERPLPDLVVDCRYTLFLQDCVAVNPQDVVDTTDPQTFSKEGELCLWVLAELDAFVHCSDDICLAQELVRDELPRSEVFLLKCALPPARRGDLGANPGG